ncbi:MAG TPA: extracellular solute-binding protein [Bacilli bacterium]|nr:extracellular solute-binding protein [Bacilli bacterium]
MKKRLTIISLLTVLLATGCRFIPRRDPSSSSKDVSDPITSQDPDGSEGDISEDSEGNLVFEDVTINYGNPITGADGMAMRQLVRDFNAEYEGQIHVNETFMAEIEYYEALNLTIPMKRAYDVALVHSYKVAAFANQGMIFPMDELITDAKLEIKREDYIGSVYDAMKFENKHYGVPLDIHTTILYYNKDLLAQYEAEVPTNRTELIAAAKKMPNTNAGGWGLPLSTTWPSEYIYTTAFYQFDGVEIDSNNKPAYNNQKGVDALHSVADLIHKDKISPLNVSVDTDLMLFNQGKAMFHINGDWMINNVKESGVNFGVTSLSKMFNENGANSTKLASRSHAFVLPDGRNITVRQQAALVFMKWMTEHAHIWAEGGGHVPASNIARERAEYLALPYHADYGEVSDFKLNPTSPYYYEAFSPVFQQITFALQNANYDAQALLDDAADEGWQTVLEAMDS